VTRLYWALNRIASPEALPLYQEALRAADAEQQELALAGLRELHASQTPAQREALTAILAAAIGAHPDPVRAAAADYLSTVPDPAVKQTFEKAVADEDPIIAPTASRYLAASEGLNLADWLAAASQRPTHARFLGARFIIADLEETWHTTKGDLAGLSWDDLATDPDKLAYLRQVLRAWEEWARDHPRTSAAFFDRPSQR